MTTIADVLVAHAPYERRTSRRGWITFNCPCCVAAGEPRPDTKQRGGIEVHSDSVRYLCFNCGTRASWSQGQFLDRKMRFVLRCFGVSQHEINRLAFDAARNQNLEPTKTVQAATSKSLEFAEQILPKQAEPLVRWLYREDCPQDAVDVAFYLNNRNLADLYGYYWTPITQVGLNRRVIIPFTHKERIVGWTARHIDEDRGDLPRYYNSPHTEHYMFNIDLLTASQKYIVIVEGPFDAIALKGIGMLGKTITSQQATWINQSGKTPIILADRDPNKYSLLDYAERYQWLVSFPWEFYGGDGVWDRDIKDAADAVHRYGRLYTVKTIIDSSHANYQRIALMKKRLQER